MSPRICHETKDDNTSTNDECIHDINDGIKKQFTSKKDKRKGVGSDVDDNN